MRVGTKLFRVEYLQGLNWTPISESVKVNDPPARGLKALARPGKVDTCAICLEGQFPPSRGLEKTMWVIL